MTYLMEIDNLGKRYDDFELSGVSLAVEPDCVVGFIGSNGAGKTTTGLAILNLIQSPPGIITRGSIAVDGQYVLKVAKPEEEEDAKAPEDGASGEVETAEESAPAEQPAAEAAQKPKKQKRMGWRKNRGPFLEAAMTEKELQAMRGKTVSMIFQDPMT